MESKFKTPDTMIKKWVILRTQDTGAQFPQITQITQIP